MLRACITACDCREEVTEPDYTFTSSASLYKDEKAEKERESRSPTPDSPHRILTLGLNRKSKDDGRQTNNS